MPENDCSSRTCRVFPVVQRFSATLAMSGFFDVFLDPYSGARSSKTDFTSFATSADAFFLRLRIWLGSADASSHLMEAFAYSAFFQDFFKYSDCSLSRAFKTGDAEATPSFWTLALSVFAFAPFPNAETWNVDVANTAIAATDAAIFLKWMDMEPERLRQYPYY